MAVVEMHSSWLALNSVVASFCLIYLLGTKAKPNPALAYSIAKSHHLKNNILMLLLK